MASVVNKLPRWTSIQAAAKLEAFAIAGCDVSGTFLVFLSHLAQPLMEVLALCINSRDRAKVLKAEICGLVLEKLGMFSYLIYPVHTAEFSNTAVVEATKNPNITMNYAHFYEVITVPYKISAVGWPGKFINPSQLSDSLPPLLEFRDSLIEGSCYFKHLSDREIQELGERYRKGVEAGDIIPMQRKTRKDKGTMKAKKITTSKTATTKKSRVMKSTELIGDSELDSDEGDESDLADRNETLVPTGTEPTRRSERRANSASSNPVLPTLPSSAQLPVATSESTAAMTSVEPTPRPPSPSHPPAIIARPSEPLPSASRPPLEDITSSINQLTDDVDGEKTPSPRTRRRKRPRNPPQRLPGFEDTDTALGRKRRRHS
jgi:hypothetical protein